eukprot:m.212672 g.212672  ORF g.212672 m.212672 type:complete len:381 (-) comp15856_c0_seq2:33-1175(-)
MFAISVCVTDDVLPFRPKCIYWQYGSVLCSIDDMLLFPSSILENLRKNVTNGSYCHARCSEDGPVVLLCRSDTVFDWNFNPSKLSNLAAKSGVFVEIVAPLFMMAGFKFGLMLTVAMHIFILLNFPFGSVQEWNIFNIVAEIFLFHVDTPDVGGESSIANWIIFMGFVITTQFMVPFIANVYPTLFSHHVALRKYTGNHPFHAFFVKPSAVNKLNRLKLPKQFVFSSFYDINANDNAAVTGAFVGHAALSATMRGRGNLKQLPNIATLVNNYNKMNANIEYDMVLASSFLGQTMNDTLYGKCKAIWSLLVEECGFREGEIVSIHIDSFPTSFLLKADVYCAKCTCVDIVTKRTIVHGDIFTTLSTKEGLTSLHIQNTTIS